MFLYRNFIKTLQKIIIWLVLALITIQATAYIALQFPATQTFIIQKIINSVSDKINGQINIEKVYFIFFNKIILKNISIVSADRTPLLDSLKTHFHQSDTLVSCGKISVSVYASDLLKLKIRLKAVHLENGVFNLQNEGEQGNTNLSRIFRIEKNKQKDTTRKGGSINLLANSLRIKNFRFTLNNPAKYVNKGDGIINFADLAVSGIDVNINQVKIERDTLFATVKNISGTDKSGFRLAGLSGNVTVSSTEARIKNLRLADDYSNINARYFSMKYDSPKDLSDFLRAVRLGADFNETFFSFKTIGKISPGMKNSTLALFLSGEVTGPVASLRSNSLQITSESGQTFIDLHVRLTGLPDIRQTMSTVKINNCYTTSNDISRIVASINGTPPSPFFSKLAPFIRYDFKGEMTGLPDDFVAHGLLSSNIGKINLDVLLKNEVRKKGFLIQGRVRTDRFNLGKLISNQMLGEITMHTSVSAFLEKQNGINLSIDSIRVNKLGFNGYNYSNIYAIGKYTDNDFDGRIICHDPNLDFIFQGLFSLNKTKTAQYNYYADIPYANLAALNFDKRDSVSIFKIRTIADFTKTAEGDIFGNINIMNASYSNSKGDFNIGSIKLTSHEADSSYSTTLTAPFINAKYHATAPFTSFLKKVIGLTIYENAGDLISKKGKDKGLFNEEELRNILGQKDEYELTVYTFNTNSICEVLLPGAYIQDSTRIDAKITRDNQLDLTLHSGRLAVKQNFLKGLNLNVSNKDSLLRINLFSENIRMAGMKLDSSSFHIYGKDNRLNASFDFKNDSTQNNNAYLNTSIRFQPDTISVGFNNSSYILLKGEKWHFKPSSFVFADSTVTIDGFELFNRNQSLRAGGSVSKHRQDSLALNLNNFDIKIANLFLNKPFNIEGYFSGSANISSVAGNPNVFLDITGDSVYVYNNPVGVMKILSKWYQPDKRFNVLISTKLEGRSNLMITGYYKPDSTYLNLGASLDNLSVTYFEPFLSDVISKTNGTLSGDLRLSGPLSKLKLEGDNCHFDDFAFTVNYTQVPYTLNGPVTLNEKGIFAKNLIISDKFGGRGNVTGGLQYDYFKEIKLNTRIQFQNLQCLSTLESDNEAFYGNAFATGSVNITGPLTNLLLDINIIPDAKTTLHIPLSAAATANQTNLLTFTEPRKSKIDPYDTLLFAGKQQKQATRLQIQLKANMNPNANIFIEINKALGDIIRANGNGLINMDINPSKDVFDIYGNYDINQGSYRFVPAGFALASKDFTIQPGGTINFNGTIENTLVDLTAIYKTKAAINTLIADTSSVSTRRTVECELGMNGNLMNPQLNFNIQIPDLDPTTKMRVESALNTEGKIQKQFAALLISGGFVPDEQSGITNNSSILYSNVSEMLSGQINNIFQQLNIPLDLGFNYQPGDKGSDIFDVAVSTQLFNNRLIINGNIGNDPYANTTNRGVIGNVDVEIKLDKNGKLRLTLFSHAADQYSNYLDDSQRSGIGVSYQQEFNTLRDIFRRKSKEQKLFEQKQKAEKKARKQAEKQQGRQIPDSTRTSQTVQP